MQCVVMLYAIGLYTMGCRENNKTGLLWPLFKPGQSRLLKDDGTTTISDLETGKVFCDYFTKVFTASNLLVIYFMMTLYVLFSSLFVIRQYLNNDVRTLSN